MMYAAPHHVRMPSRVTPRFKKQRPRYFFREWRKHRGLTQEELAEAMGISSPAISQLETGKQGFTGDTLEALAAALHCEPYDLLAVNPMDEDSLYGLFGELKKAEDRDRDRAVRMLREYLRTGTEG